MILDRFVQQPYEIRRRCIDYTPWLVDGETITDVEAIVDVYTELSPLVVNNLIVDPTMKMVTYMVGGGVDGTDYKIAFRIVTSLGQRREDDIELSVEET